MIAHIDTYRFSVEEYEKLGEVGIFHEDDRVELLEGEIVIMAPIGKHHIKAVRRLLNSLVKRYGDLCFVDSRIRWSSTISPSRNPTFSSSP